MDKQKAVRKEAGQEGAFVDLLNQEMRELQDSMKQKQIEEMARDFGEQKGYGCRAATLSCKECILQGDCMPYSYAEGAYNAGYRKIPEGAVVLTKEEAGQVYGTVKAHGKLLKDLREAKAVFEKEMEEAKKEFVKQFEEHEKELRKETAEKFAERLKAKAHYAVCDTRCVAVHTIDEICKEITEGKND